MEKLTQKTLKINEIWPNSGQVPGLPKNPRLIKNDKFEKLVNSIIEDPEMLSLREILVYPHDGKYVAIGGNMRLRACAEAGILEVPCKIIPKDTPVSKLKAYVIKDNIGYGDNDWDLLANEWDQDQLIDWGVDLPSFEEEEEGDEPMKLETFRFVIEGESDSALAEARTKIEAIISDIEGVEIKG